MGYFPNGSAGESYYEEWCARCVHDDPERGVLCPIWQLHLLHNYDDCNNKSSYLHTLIPRNGGSNDRCTMFIERGAMRDLFPSGGNRFGSEPIDRRPGEVTSD